MMKYLAICIVALATSLCSQSASEARVVVQYHNGHVDFIYVPDRYCPHNVYPYTPRYYPTYYPTYYPSPYINPYNRNNVPYFHPQRNPTHYNYHRNHGRR